MKAEDQYHAGVVVEDLDSALAKLSDLFGYRWSDPFEGRIPVWLPSGEHEVPMRFVYSRNVPRMEVILAIEGTVWVPVAESGIHHVGYWSDDVAGDGAVLESRGYVMEAAGLGANGSAHWSYHKAPGSLRIELVDRALQPLLEKLWA